MDSGPDKDHERQRVLALVKRFGWNSTSFQVLEPEYDYWFDGDNACVAYVDTGYAWVSAGRPLAEESALSKVTARFVDAAKSARRRACFFAVEDVFISASGLAAAKIGEQPSWDPQAWDKTLRATRSLREQVRRAKKKGVTARLVTEEELKDSGGAVRAGIESLVRDWLASRAMAPMGFLVDVQPFLFSEEKRFFVAEQQGQVVGALILSPVYQREGWLFEDLLRDDAAPNGTVEVLIDAAMRFTADAGATYVTLGLVPLAGVSGWLRFIREGSRSFYDFGGLHAFKRKLRPTQWSPIYLAYSRGGSSQVAILDSLTAFARGSLLRFAASTVLRGHSGALRLLAALLIPWTACLLFADTEKWFPSSEVQIAWAVFDVVVATGLFALASRFRKWLATTLALAVTCDAALTTIQAITYNAERASHISDWLIIAISCAAPAIAAAALWGSLRLRRGL